MRILITIFTFSLLAACASSQTPDPSPPSLADDRELIVLTAPPEGGLIERVEAMRYTLKAVYPLDELDDVLVVLQIPDGTTIPEAIEEVEAASPGVTAGAHHLYRVQTDDSTQDARDYASALIEWPASGCPAVRQVGMMDASVLPAHPGLSDGRIVQRRFVGGDGKPGGDHGSLMADLLVGPGRLTGTKLYSAVVVDPVRDAGDTAGVVSILRAVDWLDSNGVDLVNVSLAGPRNKLLDRGLGKVARDGMVIVAAAGNDGPAVAPLFPAAFPFVVAVTAVDRDRNIYDQAIRGDHIDVSAPGVDILRSLEGRLRVLSGTSAAAPFVTAAIAADPALLGGDVASVRRHLDNRAVDLGDPGKDRVFGAGLIRTPDSCRILAGTN